MNFLYFFLFSFSLYSRQLAADIITLRADLWCPHNCDSQADKQGYLLDIAKSVFEASGHTIQYETLNWARAVMEVREGKFNGVVGAAKTDAQDFIFPEVEQGQTKQCFYTDKESSWRYSGVVSLSSIILGVVNDYSYGDIVDEYWKKYKKEAQRISIAAGDNPLQTLITQVTNKRIGALIEDESVFFSELERLSISKDKFINVGCEKIDNIYVAFSPNNPKSQEYAKILAAGTMEMRKNGKLDEIMKRYDLKDWIVSGNKF